MVSQGNDSHSGTLVDFLPLPFDYTSQVRLQTEEKIYFLGKIIDKKFSFDKHIKNYDL